MSYVDVEDVDALWAELKLNLDLPPAGHVQRPCDQPCGQGEFAVTGPDDELIGVGGPIPARPCYFGVKPGGRRPL